MLAGDLVLKGHLNSPHQIPAPEAVVVHSSPGGDAPEILATALVVTLVTGQRPAWTRARRAMAGFRLREQQLLGCRATLHGPRVWAMLQRLSDLTWPQERDTRGWAHIPKQSHGHWGVGCSSLLTFRELETLWNILPQSGGLDLQFLSQHTQQQHHLASLLWSGLQVPVKQ